MSNSRRHRRAVDRRAALISARAQGCICRPDIDHGRVDAEGVRHMSVRHDDYCPLSDGRPGWLTVMFYDQDGCE